MRARHLLFCGLMAAGLAAAAEPEIEVEVRFMEISATAPAPAGVAWQLDGSKLPAIGEGDATNMLAALEFSSAANLISAPKVRVKSGTNTTIKVVKELIYPAGFDIRSESVTNGAVISSVLAIVPCNFTNRDAGVTLNVAPVFDARRDMIDLQMTAEIVELTEWKEYPAACEGTDGSRHTLAIAQPVFHTRRVAPNISIRNGSTAVVGGLITTGTKREEDRVPVLGAIPWLGRLFRSSREVSERRHLVITVRARTI